MENFQGLVIVVILALTFLKLIFQKKKKVWVFKENQHLNMNDRKLIAINYFLQQLGMEQ